MLRRLAGMAAIARELPGQTRVPYLAPDEITALRDRRVREIVAYAAAHVSYYRDLVASGELDPREIRTADDLARLPLLDKDEVKDQPDRFRGDRSPDGVRLRTSGSTGKPIDVWHDRDSLLRHVAWSQRERAVERKLVGRRMGYSILHISRAQSTARSVLSFYDSVAFRPLRPKRHLMSLDASFDDVAAAIERLRPAVIGSYGAYVEALFRSLAARGNALGHTPSLAIYGAEAMSAPGRRLIEEDFGIPVISRYNAVESLQIAFTCEARDGFHLNDDLCHVAVVGADGRRLPDGESGEIVISNLVNRGTVLLNYRLGDVGRIRGRGCKCGRTSRVLDDLHGRVAAIVRLPDGTLVHEHVLSEVALGPPGIVRFQFLQLEPAKFELRLQTADDDAFRDAVRAMEPRVRTLLRGAEVAFVRADDLAPRPGEKAKSVVPLAGAP